MAKVIRCRDIGVDCDFEARGETETEVLQQCAEHAKTDHGMQELPVELAEKVRSALRDEQRFPNDRVTLRAFTEGEYRKIVGSLP